MAALLVRTLCRRISPTNELCEDVYFRNIVKSYGFMRASSAECAFSVLHVLRIYQTCLISALQRSRDLLLHSISANRFTFCLFLFVVNSAKYCCQETVSALTARLQNSFTLTEKTPKCSSKFVVGKIPTIRANVLRLTVLRPHTEDADIVLVLENYGRCHRKKSKQKSFQKE